MPLTARELLQDESMRLTAEVETDLDVPISWIHVTELPDPSAYLQGGELVLTTSVGMAGRRPKQFANALSRCGVAALGYGLRTSDETIPRSLVGACADEGICLLRVPHDQAFSLISRAFFERVAREREERLRTTLRENEELVQVMGEGLGMSGLLGVVARHSRLHAWVIGPGSKVRSSLGSEPLASGEVCRIRETAAGNQPSEAVSVAPRLVDSWSVYPIYTASGTDAYLVLDRTPDELTTEDQNAIQCALPFLGMELEHERALSETERRFAVELIDLINAGPGQLPAVSARLEAFGLDSDLPLVIGVCETPAANGSQGAIGAALRERSIQSIVAIKTPEIVVITQVVGPDVAPLDLARLLRETIAGRGAVGVGSVARSVSGLKASLVAARHACRFARRHRPQLAYAAHQELGSHSVLLALQDEDVLREFQLALLGSLLAHDAQHHSDLVKTLEAFLMSGGRWKHTAEALHIHVNTLRHRLSRVEHIAERDLSSMEDRVDFFIAIRSLGDDPLTIAELQREFIASRAGSAPS